MSSSPLVAVILVNFRGANDTIECIQSILHSTYGKFCIFVYENHSEDRSFEKFEKWSLLESTQIFLKQKDFRCCFFDNSEINEFEPTENEIYFLQGETNRGFAGGNNRCFQLLEHTPAPFFAWLLNSDTIVAPEAMQEMVNVCSSVAGGMTGSQVRYYFDQQNVQAYGGGLYNAVFATTRHLENLEKLAIEDVASNLDYIYGASLMVSSSFLSDVGPMQEDYFIYFEELDWAQRSKKKWKLGYAHKAVVYHKHGQSTGGTSVAASRSDMSDYYSIRGRCLFTVRYFPMLIPTVLIGMIGVTVNRIRRGQWRRLPLLARGVVDGLSTAFINVSAQNKISLKS